MRSLLPPFQACPLHYLSPFPALYQVRLKATPSPIHLETAAETEHRTDHTERQATNRQENERHHLKAGETLPLRGKEGLRGIPGRSAQCRLKPKVGWRRGEQQVQVPGHSEERAPQRLRPPQYLDVLHKVINVNFHLPRIFQGPLNNHLLVLPGVIGTR